MPIVLDSSVSFETRANDVNNAGQVVGMRVPVAGPYFEQQRAMLWDANGATDLNSFLSPADVDAGWVLREATGINDAGSITGNASNSHMEDRFAFTLTVSGGPSPPVPEPATCALLAVGLLAVFMAGKGVTP
jgi:hypothetical protein